MQILFRHGETEYCKRKSAPVSSYKVYKHGVVFNKTCVEIEDIMASL